MVKLTVEQKTIFPGLPLTERGHGLVLGFDPKGKNFLYCTRGCVVIRDIENPKENDCYFDHQKQPTSAKYSYTGFYICSGDAGGCVRIWDTVQKEHILKCEFSMIGGKILDIAWDADSKRIAVCGEGRESFARVFMWDSGSSVGDITKIGKIANSVDIKRVRPYRLAVASDDFKTYFYEGPPFKHSSTHEMTNGRFAQCVRYSPDGKYVATCNNNGKIELLDGKSAEPVGFFGPGDKAHSGAVTHICFSPDSSELLSASLDKTCKIWNVETREMVVEFVLGSKVENQQCSCLWQGNHLLSVSLSGEINYLDRNNPSKPSRVITGHNKGITALAVKPKEAIFTADVDGIAVKWNPETGDGIRFVGNGHGAKVVAMAYVSSTNKLVSIGLDNKVRFVCCDSCEYSSDTISLDSEPSSLSVSDDYIVVACQNELVLIKDGKKLSSLPWDDNKAAAVSVFGHTIFSTGKKIQKMDYKEVQECLVYEIEGDSIVPSSSMTDLKEVPNVAISQDGARLALLNDKEICIYEVSDGFKEPSKTLLGHGTKCSHVEWSPNNQYLASVSVDTTLIVWDVATKKYVTIRRSHPKSFITSLAWLDEHTLVSTAGDNSVKQWNVSF